MPTWRSAAECSKMLARICARHSWTWIGSIHGLDWIGSDDCDPCCILISLRYRQIWCALCFCSNHITAELSTHYELYKRFSYTGLTTIKRQHCDSQWARGLRVRFNTRYTLCVALACIGCKFSTFRFHWIHTLMDWIGLGQYNWPSSNVSGVGGFQDDQVRRSRVRCGSVGWTPQTVTINGCAAEGGRGLCDATGIGADLERRRCEKQ